LSKNIFFRPDDEINDLIDRKIAELKLVRESHCMEPEVSRASAVVTILREYNNLTKG
jgi:hypothetical protein